MELSIIFVIAVIIISVMIPSSAEKCFLLENCSCPEQTRVMCVHANFTDVPRNISTHLNILWLDLNGNNITTLTNTTFVWDNNSAKDIYHLNLNHNQIDTIEVGALQPLSNLTYLNLASNNLRLFPGAVLENNQNLTVLSLSRNVHLQLTSSGYNLPKIKKLNLQHCRLNQIPIQFFETMRNITDLNIANNHLSHLDADVFAPLGHLEMLSLQQNRLKSLTSLLKVPPSVEVELWGNPWHCNCKLATDFHHYSKTRSRKSLLCGFTFDNTFKINSTSYLSICEKNDSHLSGSHHTVTWAVIAFAVLVVAVVAVVIALKPLRRYIARILTGLYDSIVNLRSTTKQVDEDNRDLIHNALELGEELPSQ